MRYHGICSNFGFWPWWLTSNCFLPSETGIDHDMREFIWMEYGIFNDRRKFRSQTSDNMDGWKSRGGKSQRREEQKREDLRRERVRGKKMQVREKVAKSRNTVFSQWFVAPEGRKVGSLKRQVRSHLARWEMKNCTPLWPEAHVEVKMYKAPHVRSKLTCRKSARCCGAKHISKSNVQNTSCSEHFWKLRCRKSARCRGAKHLSKSKCAKHQLRSTFGSWDVKKAHAVVARSIFRSQHIRSTTCRSDVISCGRREGLCTLSKVSEMWGFCSSFNYNYITPHYITLITLHYTTLHSATLH